MRDTLPFNFCLQFLSRSFRRLPVCIVYDMFISSNLAFFMYLIYFFVLRIAACKFRPLSCHTRMFFFYSYSFFYLFWLFLKSILLLFRNVICSLRIFSFFSFFPCLTLSFIISQLYDFATWLTFSSVANCFHCVRASHFSSGFTS